MGKKKKEKKSLKDIFFFFGHCHYALIDFIAHYITWKSI